MFERIITVPCQPLLDDGIPKRKEKKKEIFSFPRRHQETVRTFNVVSEWR